MSLSPLAAADFEECERIFGLRLDEERKLLVWDYWQLLQAWNRKLSLTSIGSFREALQFHFFESFWVSDHFLQEMHRIADVGSGAGFPGLAIKLYRPDLEAVLLESNHKKAVFLSQAARVLDAAVEVFDAPAEDFPSWKGVDAALIRALKPSSRLIDILRARRIPLIHFHGASSQMAGNLQLEAREKVPGSRNRTVSRYLPL